MIVMKNICKTYRVAKRNAGFGAAVKSFFHREYETVTALDNVSFSIQDGETVGYIGPNGAGKSTTIKILSGILTPDSGECLVDGRTPWKNRIEHVLPADLAGLAPSRAAEEVGLVLISLAGDRHGEVRDGLSVGSRPHFGVGGEVADDGELIHRFNSTSSRIISSSKC